MIADELAGFHRAILEEPEQEEHWLIMADWLDERGDSDRAEFVRILVALEHLERDLGRFARAVEPTFVDLAQDRQRLLRESGSRWELELPSRRAAREAWRFREPFGSRLVRPVEVIRLEKFLKHSPWRVGGEPVRSLAFPSSCPLPILNVRRLTELEEAAFLTEVRFEGDVQPGVEALRELLGSPRLTRVRTVAVNLQTFPLPAVYALLRARSQPQWTALELKHDRLSRPEIDELARAVSWANLETLDLHGNRLDDACIAALFGAQPDWRLRRLALGGNRLGRAGVEVLAEADALERIVTLDLSNNRLGPDGVAALVDAPVRADLRALDLGGNRIGDEAVLALADAEPWEQLGLLNLSGNRLGDAGVEGLANAPGLATLHALYLDRNRIGSRGAEALAESPILADLRELTLSDNRIDDLGAHALAESPHLDVVRFLDLGENPIGPAGAAALTRRFGNRVSLDA